MSLQQAADGDFSGAKYAIALEDFAHFIQYFHDYAYAPVAQYHIGEIYERSEQWDDAAKAFDSVVEQFPKNEKTVDAAYFKAVMLQKGGHKAEAKEEYQNFLSNYPTSEHARMARQESEPPWRGWPRSSRQKASNSSVGQAVGFCRLPATAGENPLGIGLVKHLFIRVTDGKIVGNLHLFRNELIRVIHRVEHAIDAQHRLRV